MKNLSLKNQLNESRSLYLLQHAHNPVDWQIWDQETLDLAKKFDKPLLISIGYSACHWCHVMAHETFEDENSARIMNNHFLCVKIDREERPDIDAIYMQAVQLMTGAGGWPLHIFALPDGRPFFGGTYFPREQWQHICRTASYEFDNNREKLINYAENVEKGLHVRVPVISSHETSQFKKDNLLEAIKNLQERFDQTNGGLLGAPKFPMPSIINLLHDFSLATNNLYIQKHVRLTLNKMAMGGIYDHIGGGYSRYSVDSRWKVPHFEKMLYDNAQLLSLLSKAHRTRNSLLYEERIQETANFLTREMATPEDLFASSLDADSDGIEGGFYTWEKSELKQLLGTLFPLAKTIFSIDEYGYWENENYILQMQHDYETLSQTLDIPIASLRKSIDQIKHKLYKQRSIRKPPARDEKALTSWNGLAIEGLTHAANALDQKIYLTAAQKAAANILHNMRMENGGLYHVFSKKHSYIPGFLDDYSFMISALITLYQADFNENWLHHARSLMDFVFEHFLDKETGFFYFTADDQTKFLKRDIKLTDGVTPSANSVLGHALLDLSRFFIIPNWESHAQKMTLNMAEELVRYPYSYSHWTSLYLKLSNPSVEISIVGDLAHEYLKQLQDSYHPGMLISGSVNKSSLPILSGRFRQNTTLIYVCRDKVCSEPMQSIHAAQQFIQNN